ncbi:hypothetical protein F0562_017371 [Nyssa sinensis]|uniref:Leucine-rich repeat-containing N-terminal plant-type domain-containing protein n=1 Tax=Nyssa sinensis TaxID=561372 RepID=A0A5J4ZHR1_9ASTE|nr:hypothetical protein F0562_017371 [Nyssa sinensis]
MASSPAATTPNRLLLMSSKFRSLINDLISLPMPTIAVISGHASATGFILALCHDYVLMRKDRGFLYMSEVDIKLKMPAWFVPILRYKIGSPTAWRDVVLKVEKLTAEVAIEKGIIDSAHTSMEETMKAALRLGEELVSRKWDGHELEAGFLPSSQLVIAQLLHDEKTLLAIGNELGLSGWGLNNSGYCSWPGIDCGSNNSMVEKLDLSRRGLQGNVTLISELKALKWLDLSYNNFHGSIPPAFGNLSDLEFLDLSSNKFGSSIPTELGRLRNLRSLNLSNNWLTGAIPDELEGLKKLQHFQIFTNRLSGSIPIWVGNLTNLRVFTAYEN